MEVVAAQTTLGSSVGPQRNLLINKFKNTRTLAWLIFSVSAIAQLGLFLWLILDATAVKRDLQKFELGQVQTCPNSASQSAIIIKTLLALGALVGTAIGLIVLSSNPLDIKRVL